MENPAPAKTAPPLTFPDGTPENVKAAIQAQYQRNVDAVGATIAEPEPEKPQHPELQSGPALAATDPSPAPGKHPSTLFTDLMTAWKVFDAALKAFEAAVRE